MSARQSRWPLSSLRCDRTLAPSHLPERGEIARAPKGRSSGHILDVRGQIPDVAERILHGAVAIAIRLVHRFAY